MGTTNNRSASNHSGGKTSKVRLRMVKRDPYASIEKRAVKIRYQVMVERRNNGSIIGFTLNQEKTLDIIQNLSIYVIYFIREQFHCML